MKRLNYECLLSEISATKEIAKNNNTRIDLLHEYLQATNRRQRGISEKVNLIKPAKTQSTVLPVEEAPINDSMLPIERNKLCTCKSETKPATSSRGTQTASPTQKDATTSPKVITKKPVSSNQAKNDTMKIPVKNSTSNLPQRPVVDNKKSTENTGPSSTSSAKITHSEKTRKSSLGPEDTTNSGSTPRRNSYRLCEEDRLNGRNREHIKPGDASNRPADTGVRDSSEKKNCYPPT